MSLPVGYPLYFTCPLCDKKLAAVGAMYSATQVVKRKCRKCSTRWQLVVRVVQKHTGVHLHIAEFTMIGEPYGEDYEQDDL